MKRLSISMASMILKLGRSKRSHDQCPYSVLYITLLLLSLHHGDAQGLTTSMELDGGGADGSSFASPFPPLPVKPARATTTTLPNPPYCILPPALPLPPPYLQAPPPPPFYFAPIDPTIPSPPGPVQNPLTPPEAMPNLPPTICIPSPPDTVVPNPPTGFEPNPPIFNYPPVFQPPVVYPPPSVPPPPPSGPAGLWCVAKPSVPDPIIQEAMDYACGSGADCVSIQDAGPCFSPNTLINHASYAFNSYWQRTKVAGGTCDFGGVAAIIANDPSYDDCSFIYNQM